jgi:hypothetical protein
MPHHQLRLEVCRPLIENLTHFVIDVKSFLIRDKLPQKLQQLREKYYYWNPI